MRITRRELIERVGAAGGFGAAFVTMQGLGLLPGASAVAELPEPGTNIGPGARVVVLGAGIAGLVAAYELQRTGFEVVVLEARQRPGGRNWTLRGGDRVVEIGHQAQTCQFDDGLYFNPGAARIPSQHTGILAYCRELGVQLEVFINANRSALYQDDTAFDGQPIVSRRLRHDLTGHVSELLVKALASDVLDGEVNEADRARLSAFLRVHGALDRSGAYRGSTRSGLEPDAEGRRPLEPLDLGALLRSRYWHWHLYFEETFEQQATMLQPVGGMDRIAMAFARALGDNIRFGREVVGIRKREAGVRVVHRAGEGEDRVELAADYCVCTLPLPVLGAVSTDLSIPVRRAIAEARYAGAFKLAWQADRRFWEEDHGIYGGISWTTRPITQIWYPSHGFHAARGVLLGAYAFDPGARAFGAAPPARRFAAAREGALALHPQFATEVSRPVSVAWRNIPYSRGAFANWTADQRARLLPVLEREDERIFLAGEHLSEWTAWQEGAVQSAHRVVAALHERVRAVG